MLKRILTHLQIRKDPIGYARGIGVKVGSDCRLLGVDTLTFGSEPYLVELGDHVSITEGVRFVTHDGGVWVFRNEHPGIDLIAPIRVGNNVFIGMNVVIMPGVEIGDNCVIGAGAVVTRSVPTGYVAVGVPAKPLKRVEEYKHKALQSALDTKNLSSDAKKDYLLRHFRNEHANSKEG